jgi:biotin synthase
MSGIDLREALGWIEAEGADLVELLSRASAARQEHRGDEVQLCAIVNARCGGCPDDCAFCAQSSHNDAAIQRHALLSRDEMVASAHDAAGWGVQRFSMVTSGRAVSAAEDVAVLAETTAAIREQLPVKVCASLGRVRPDVLAALVEAGLDRYHCNLETAESHWGNVCTTRRYSDTYDTLMAAREAGLSLCSGGIFGLGEDAAQRVELLAKVRELDVDSVPINFLHPIPGTPLGGTPLGGTPLGGTPLGGTPLGDGGRITPLECIKAVAVARLMMPDKVIRICGGREHALRDLHSWVLLAGADGLMVGNYLTTAGREVEDDLRMIADAGLAVAPRRVGGAA